MRITGNYGAASRGADFFFLFSSLSVNAGAGACPGRSHQDSEQRHSPGRAAPEVEALGSSHVLKLFLLLDTDLKAHSFSSGCWGPDTPLSHGALPGQSPALAPH